jgi:uncharacterized repeat protein (TIGR01451 family)
MRKWLLGMFAVSAVAAGVAYHMTEPLLESEADEEGPPASDYWITRYTYPTGHFDPRWATEAARQERMLARAKPIGTRTYDKSRVPDSPLALDPGRFIPLGPMPENNTQMQYGSVSGRINVIAVDPVDPTIAYAGSDGGGIWKTTTCCSMAAPPANTTSWTVVTDVPEVAGLSISDITIDPHDHNTIYAATGDLNYGSFSFGATGVLKSTDQGETWRVLGTETFGGHYDAAGFPQYQAIGKVAVDPNRSQTVIAGTKTSVFFSYDAGENWVGPCYTNPYATGATPQRQDITGLVPVDNGNGTSRLYVAVGTRGAPTPVQPDLGQTGSNGVYRLDVIPTGGCPATNAWTLLDNGWPAGTGNGVAGATDIGRIELAVSPSQPSTMYAMAASAANRNVLGVWRSDDAGDTWTQRASTAAVARCGSDSNSAGGGSQMWYDAGLTVHPTDPETTILSGFDIYRSTNGGSNYVDITCGWTTKPAGTLDHVHVDQHARAFIPGSPNKMLVGSDGGVFYTEDADAPFPSFRQLNNTINSIEFYFGDITSNFANSATPAIGAGAQDNGCSATKFTGMPTGPQLWTSNCSGDGTTTKIEPIGNAIWFNSSQYGSLARSLTYGNTMSGTFSTASGNTGGTWGGAGDLSSTIFAMSYDIYKWGALDAPGSGCSTANGCNHMIAGTNRLWETVDMTNPTTSAMRASWKARTPNLTKNNLLIGSDNRSYINYVAYSFTDPTVAAVGTNDGNVQLVFGLGTAAAANCPAAPPLDGNCATAVNVTDDNNVLPNRPIFGVRFDPRTALVAYAAVGGFNPNTPGRPGHVFQVTCSDYNCPSFTWKDKTGNLPDIPVEQIMPNPNRPDQVFAGTDWGLYYTDDISADSPTWYYFEDFPRVMVWELVVDRGFTTLAAFTRSRGAWVWPLPDAAIGTGADLAAAISGSSSVNAGGQVSYAITVTNNGPNAASNVTLSSPVPAGLLPVSVSGDCTSLPCSFAHLARTASRTVTVVYGVPADYAGASIVANASVTSATVDETPANNSASTSTTVSQVASADLELAMAAPATAGANANVSFTLTLTNHGPATANAISVADATPAGLTFVSNAGDCAHAFPCTFASLAPGASKTIIATYAVPDGYAGASIVNTATVTSASDDNPANDSASATVAVTREADLAVAIQATSNAVRGSTFTVTIAVTNNGPASASAVNVAASAPAGVAFVANTGACTTAFPCSFASVAPGAPRLITTTYSVPSTYAGADPIVISANATAATTDPQSANNVASANVTLANSADLSVTQSGPGAALAGTTVSYTITVANAGPSDAANVMLSDPLPVGVTLLGVGGDCTAFPCVLGTIVPGSARTATVTYEVPADYSGANPLANVASVTSSTDDPNLGNNIHSATTTIGAGADVAITFEGPDFVERGSEATYMVRVTNNGPSSATGVEATSTLPSGVTLVSNVGDCSGAWPCTFGTLAAGETKTVAMTVCIGTAAAQPLHFVATATAATTDPYAGNNTAGANVLFSLESIFRNGFDAAGGCG